MRINCYAEELTDDTEMVVKTVEADPGGPEEDRQFYGVRVYLQSPDVLHHSPADDDRSAITLFVPWTKAGGHDFGLVESALNGLLERLADARAHAGA